MFRGEALELIESKTAAKEGRTGRVSQGTRVAQPRVVEHGSAREERGPPRERAEGERGRVAARQRREHDRGVLVVDRDERFPLL